MFEHLTDLSYKRNRKQAIGFYLALLLAGSILTAIIVFIYLHVTGAAPPLQKGQGFHASYLESMRTIQGMEQGVVPFVVFLISTAMAILIVRAKKVQGRVVLLCVVLAAALSILGALFSFIPVAYLTTLPKSAGQGK